jgi:acetyltransferase
VLANTAECEQVAAGLRSPAEIQLAVRGLRNSARLQQPRKRVTGYRLRPSGARSGTPALRLGVAEDSLFGPLIFLGPAAGAGARRSRFVVALPPLNLTLAQDLVARSGFAAEAPEGERAALEAAVSQTLVRLSQLLTDIDAVVGAELDPLFVETSGVVALDVRLRISKGKRLLGLRRFAIRPYPKELEQPLTWEGRQLLIRPIRPEDETRPRRTVELAGSRGFADAIFRLDQESAARAPRPLYPDRLRSRDGAGGHRAGQRWRRSRSLGEVRAVADPGSVLR